MSGPPEEHDGMEIDEEPSQEPARRIPVSQPVVEVLRFVPRHGGGWYGSSRDSFVRLAEALDIGLTIVRQVAREVLPKEQYATAFGVDAPEEQEVIDLRRQVLGKKVSTDQLPALSEVPEDVVTGYEPYVQDLDQQEKDEQEELLYAMSPGEEQIDDDELPDLIDDADEPEDL